MHNEAVIYGTKLTLQWRDGEMPLRFGFLNLPFERRICTKGTAFISNIKAPGVIVLRISRIQATLEDLVAGITPQNRNGETDWGKPKGKGGVELVCSGNK
jgi:hypothetical protein